jgi:hypothetical protein
MNPHQKNKIDVSVSDLLVSLYLLRSLYKIL